jgi:hypothetical protein
MTATEAIQAVTAGGGRFIIVDGRIRVSGPDILMSPEFVAVLKRHRNEVMERLTCATVRPPKPQLTECMTVREFKNANIAVAIDSDVLGERVYFASNAGVLAVDGRGLFGGLAVYYADELRLLTDATAEELRLIHECKNALGGSVVNE